MFRTPTSATLQHNSAYDSTASISLPQAMNVRGITVAASGMLPKVITPA